jgi:hypothetical protein
MKRLADLKRFGGKLGHLTIGQSTKELLVSVLLDAKMLEMRSALDINLL